LKRFQVKRAYSNSHWLFRDEIKLVWTDPPFGTGKRQTQGEHAYEDVDLWEAIYLTVDAIDCIRDALAPDGVIVVCTDDRITHDICVALGELGLHHQGDIIWTFGLGRPRSNWWPRRHNTLSTFTRQEKLPPFDKSAVPRDVRKAPKTGYPDDKPMGSVWDVTLSNTDSERVGYPNQKPLAIVEPFVLAHTSPGDLVADPFMGSGTTGAAALRLGRRFQGQDANPKALLVAKERLRSTKRQN
jgi:site-specific DNA-methyltransferase (adenine-specific)